MLAKTSDVLSRASVGSSAQLEQRLYDELGDATMADIMNHAIGGIFSNASKCIFVISTGSVSSDWETKNEERRILFNGIGGPDVPIGNFRYAKMISGNPPFFKIDGYERSHTLTKTLLGEMVGDIFAVRGIYAGIDPRFGEPLACVLKPSGHTGDLGTPLLSLLIMEWTNANRENPTLSRFIKETKLLHNGTQKERTGEYSAVSARVNNVAKSLSQKGFVVYRSRGPGDRNIYTPVNNVPLSTEPPYGISIDAVVPVWNKLLKNKASAQEIAATIHYSPQHVRSILNWLVDAGYAKMNYGKPRERSLPIKSTRKSRRLCGYVDQSMTLLGFYPERNGIGSIWEPPKIDVAGLVRYREELIDTLYGNADKRAAFEEACRIAYRKHVAQLGRGRNRLQ